MLFTELLYALSTFCYSLLMQFHADGGFNQDLGRHLKLGELIVSAKSLPFTNLFTYTYPNYQFVNHHWFSEVIFYLVNLWFGLWGLFSIRIIVFMILGLLLWTCFKKKSGTRFWFYLFQFMLLPLFLDRSDLRPEIFGYIFFALFICLLLEKRSLKYLYLIPVTMLFWVNMHITFVFGYLLMVLIFLTYGKKSIPAVTLGFVAMLLNPRGLYGAIFPFLIFKDYGYAIAENQNIFFLLSNTNNIHLKYFIFLTPVFLLTLIVLVWKKRFIFLLLFVIFFALTLTQERHLPFFIITAMVCCPLAFYYLEKNLKVYVTRLFPALTKVRLFITTVVLFSVGMLFFYGNLVDQNQYLHLGFQIDYEPATNFLLREKLPGTIFNNFDIGGYLDYRLYPTYKTFVDNRPDAFPSVFFTDVYIPMQQDATLWDKLSKRYGIKTIIFSHTDQTPWAQIFLQRILNDSGWKLVYLDGTVLILTNKTNYVDIRQNTKNLQSVVMKEDDARKLLYLSRILDYLGSNELVTLVLKRAQELQPNSCAVNSTFYNVYKNQDSEYAAAQALNIRNNYWYCF